MGIQITDCTIRDGGYLLNKKSDEAFVKGVIAGLVDAGIDFVETGFLQDKVNGETIVYHNSKDIVKYLPEEKKDQTILDSVITAGIRLKTLTNMTENHLSGCVFPLLSTK